MVVMCEAAFVAGKDTVNVKVEVLYRLLHERTALIKKLQALNVPFFYIIIINKKQINNQKKNGENR